MAHDHDHHHGDRNAFYMEQIATIGVCGLFASVTLILWYSGALNKMLADKFHIWVLLGGATLLLFAVINAVAVWFSVGDAKAVPVQAHNHDHDHHDHDHSHGEHDHAHGHGHDHSHAHEHSHAPAGIQSTPAAGLPAATGLKQDAPAAAAVAALPLAHDHSHDGHDHSWAPWRYAVLLLPVAIYFVVPLEALSSAGAAGVFVDDSNLRTSTGVENAKNVDESITFQQLELAAIYKSNREFYEGKMVRLVGQYVPQDARHFTLRRIKISCCVADGVPLNAVIIIDPSSKDTLDMNRLQGKWIQVTGRVEFLKRKDGVPGAESYATTLVLTPTDERPLFNPSADPGDIKALVKEVLPPANPYLN